MSVKIPRILIAGLAGDSGKTIVSLSLMAALKNKGLAIAAFKKGPDYIDAAWLSYAAQSTCRNLDTYLVPERDVIDIFTSGSQSSDISLIEGNRGIFDGKDVSGTHSTSGLAKLLQAPVVLVVDVTKSTRTIAALVKGCMDFDPDLNIAGVILNKVAGARHQNIISAAIEKYCHLPILGAIPKLGDSSKLIPGRHLGLVTPSEYAKADDLHELLLKIGTEYIDCEKIIATADNAEPLDFERPEIKESPYNDKVRIGYFSDSVFTFYYPENLEALEKYGAELVAISSINDKELPPIDALYIGGGFPETQAEKLVDNKSMIASVRKAAVSGMPIYAECGGLIYLSRSLLLDDKLYPMAGVFPIDLKMNIKPVGHGYTSVKVDSSNPFYEMGAEIKGHEFHYSGTVGNQTESGLELLKSCLQVEKGCGLGNKRDGLTYLNTLACYTHIHAAGTKFWAPAMIRSATIFKENTSNQVNGHPVVIQASSWAAGEGGFLTSSNATIAYC